MTGKGAGGCGVGGEEEEDAEGGRSHRLLTAHPSSWALKGAFQPPEGSRASMQSQLSGQGWLIPESGHTFQSFPSKLAKDRHSHVGCGGPVEAGGASVTETEHLLWRTSGPPQGPPPLLQGPTTIYHPLALSKRAINNRIFSHTSPVRYELPRTFFYWAFSIMDNKFIQTFSPSKYTMKYKTGILHYAIKTDKIQYDNNSGSNSNHISMHTSGER